MVYLGGLSLFVSMVGLYILIFSSFRVKENEDIQNGYVNKETRKIRFHQGNQEKEKEKDDSTKPNPRFILLVETILIGQIVGVFFLWLSNAHLKFTFLAINGAYLLVASFFCSILTLFNAWLKKKTHIIFRIGLQIVTLILGIILMKISIKEKTLMADDYMIYGIYSYYITVVVAIGSMLYNVITGSKTKDMEFNYSNYLLLVIISGLVIGTGLLFASSPK